MVDLGSLFVKVTPQGIKDTIAQLKGLESQSKATEKAVDKLTGETKDAEVAMHGFEMRVGSIAGGPLSAFKAALIGLPIAFLAKQMFDFGKSVIDVGARFEVLDRQLRSVMGSDSGAEQAMRFIEKFTADTPLQLEQVSEAFNMLKSIGIDPMNGSLQAITDATSFTAQGYEGLIGVTRQLGQAWAKERLSGEEVLRLRERMIPVYDLLAEKMGKTTKQIRDMAEKGELGRKEIQLLFEAMGDKYGGAAARVMDTLTGKISNLGDTWTLIQRRLSESGGLEAVKLAVDTLSEALTTALETGRIDKFANVFGKTLAGVALLIEATFTALPAAVELSVKTATQLILDMLAGLEGPVEKITKFAGPFLAVAGPPGAIEGLLALRDATKGAAAESSSMQAEIDALSEELSTSVASILKHKAALDALSDGSQKAGAAVEGAGDSFKETGDDADDATKKVEKFFTQFKLGDAMPDILVFGENVGEIAEKANFLDMTFDELEGTTGALQQEFQKVVRGLMPAPPIFNTTASAAANAAEKMQQFRESFKLGDFTANDLLHGLELLKVSSSDAEDAIRAMNVETGETEVTFEMAEKIAAKFNLTVEDVATAMGFAKNGTQQFKTELEKLNAVALAFSNEFKQSIVDLFGGTFQNLLEGQFESLGDFIGEWFSNLGQMAGETIINQIVTAMFSKDVGLKDAWKSLFGEEGALTGWAGRVAGAGMVYSGYQQGGGQGALSGAIGGAIAGATFTPMMPAVGAIIGGVIGGVVGYLGGKDQDKPIMNVSRIGVGPGWQEGTAGLSTQNAGMSAEEDRLLSIGIAATYRAVNAGWRDLIRGFGELELFDFLLEMPEIIDESFEMTAQSFQQWLQQDKLPQMFLGTYAHALERGLSNLQFTHEMFSQLYAEMIDMTGDERMEGLGHLVAGLRQMNEMLGMDFEALEARAGENFMDQFLRFTGDAADQMEILTAGWDDMGIMERAADLENIGAIFENITTATIQMLQQLDAMARQLNQQFESVIRGFETRGMSDKELWSYLEDEFNRYRDLLSTTTDPALIAEYNNRLLDILRQAGGLIPEDQWRGGMAGDTGQTWQEWFIEMTRTAQEAADEAIREQRARIENTYNALYGGFEEITNRFLTLATGTEDVTTDLDDLDTSIEDVIDSLDIFGNRLINFAPTVGGAEGVNKALGVSSQTLSATINIEAPEPPIVKVNINGSLAVLQSMVDVAIERRAARMQRQVLAAIS